MSTGVTQLVTEYKEKAKALKKQMKNPTSNASTFSNNDFKGKNLHFANQGGTITSRHDKLENYFFTGYPYKRGVKLVVDTNSDGITKPHYEPHIEVGGVRMTFMEIDIDEFTSTATVLPITNNFQGYLVAKENSGIKRKDKLKFDANGELEKDSLSNGKINAMALSDAIELDTEKKLCMVHVAIYGNKGKPS